MHLHRLTWWIAFPWFLCSTPLKRGHEGQWQTRPWLPHNTPLGKANTVSHKFLSVSPGMFYHSCQVSLRMIHFVSTSSLNTDVKYLQFNWLALKTSTFTSGDASCRKNLHSSSVIDGSAVFKLVLLKSAGLLCLLTSSTGISSQIYCVLCSAFVSLFPWPRLNSFILVSHELRATLC